MLPFPQISKKENIDLLPALLAATPVDLHCHLPPHQHRHPPSPSNLPQVLSFLCISKKVNADLLPTLLAATFSQSLPLPSSPSSSALAFPLQSPFSAFLLTDLQKRKYRPPLRSPCRHLPLISAVTFLPIVTSIGLPPPMSLRCFPSHGSLKKRTSTSSLLSSLLPLAGLRRHLPSHHHQHRPSPLISLQCFSLHRSPKKRASTSSLLFSPPPSISLLCCLPPYRHRHRPSPSISL